MFLIIFIVLQQVDNHLIYPHVVGRSVGLPAIWIFIAVIVGGNVAGVVGMVLMIPIVALIYALHHENAAIVHELEEEEKEQNAPKKKKERAPKNKNVNNVSEGNENKRPPRKKKKKKNYPTDAQAVSQEPEATQEPAENAGESQ